MVYDRDKFLLRKNCHFYIFTLLSLQLNLAHVYLLNDNFSKSKSLHKNYFNQNINTDTTWVKQTQLDFIQLQKLGLESKNYKKILIGKYQNNFFS